MIDGGKITTKPDLLWQRVNPSDNRVESVMMEVKRDLVVNTAEECRMLGQQIAHMLAYATQRQFWHKEEVTVSN